MIEIKTDELDKYIHFFIKKPYSEELVQEDLIKIKKLVLNKFNIKGEAIKYNYNDLKLLKCLGTCIIENLDITDDLINSINFLENLESLEFDFCKIKSNIMFKCKLKKLLLSNVNNSFLEIFNNYNEIEKLQIIQMKNVDLERLLKYEKIKKLYIYNSDIINSNYFSYFSDLNELKLDGSTLDNSEILKHLNKKIKIQYREKYILTNY